MAIQKKPYEISVWHEELTGVGTKKETKLFVIGAHDMNYEGKATAIKFKTKLNGTHELSFQLPDKYFDHEKGDFVRNSFVDDLFAEQKIKLYYKDKWYELYIKTIKEDKKFKSYMKTYTCSDAFIDELSRNGYGLTFDEELYNNVEEIGTFTEEILEDSVWYYSPQNNWGDFTEYQEEKLFKIPIDLFGGTISGYKFNFKLDGNLTIENVYTGDARAAELGDDLARVNKKFWDNQNGTMPLKSNFINNIENDGYVYVPYSCLDFCYTNTDVGGGNIERFDRAATESAVAYPNKIELAIAPPSVDPRYLIQFICIPKGEKIEIDDAGLIVSKNYSYFMTLRQWNEQVQKNYWYIFRDTRYTSSYVEASEDDKLPISHTYKYLVNAGDSSYLDTYQEALGNKIVYSEGYASEFAEDGIVKGKKISVANRSEINISDEIDSYVTVYKNKPTESNYKNLFMNEDWAESEITSKYRICSTIGTRQIVPQLARNYVQNGVEIKSTDGWEVMELMNNKLIESAILKTVYTYSNTINAISGEYDIETPYLYFKPCRAKLGVLWKVSNNVDIITGNTTISIDAGQYIEAQGDLFYYNGTSSDPYDPASGNIIACYRPLSLTEEQLKSFKRGNISGIENKGDYYIEPSTNPGSGNYGYYYWFQNYLGDNQNDIISQTLSVGQKSLINFGAVAQDKKIEKGKIYCIGFETLIQTEHQTDTYVHIAEGSILSDSSYTFDEKKCISFNLRNSGGNIYTAIIPGNDSTWTSLSENKNLYNLPTGSFYALIQVDETIEHPYFIFESNGPIVIKAAYLFEAYTKGADQFDNSSGNLRYRYSGRDLNITNWTECTNNGFSYRYFHADIRDFRNMIIFEDDIMPGDTYEYQEYFIQRLKLKDGSNSYDTMGVKSYTASENIGNNSLPLDAAYYTDEDFTIETNYINLNNCPYYKQTSSITSCDCSYSGAATKTCMYQRDGYCPYLFEAEKHCRKIRTLKGEKSNRFNLIQELGKVFKVYPMFYTNNDSQGNIITTSGGVMDKRIFFITEKGKKNDLGFRFEKNLTNISRTIKSDQIVSKLYVQDVDSEISRTGMCSIKTAEDNPTKDSFVIDFSYYVAKGMLDAETVEEDLYGKEQTDNSLPQGYLKQLGYYNTEYDKLSNKIINLQDASFTELEANLNVNLEGIETAVKQLRKLSESLDRYKGLGTDNSTYISYRVKYAEQQGILQQLIVDTFQTNGVWDTDFDYPEELLIDTSKKPLATDSPMTWLNKLNSYKFKDYWLNHHEYNKGILGQYNREFLQIEEWKKQRASYLKQINKISQAFFKKYEPYLKEGTWSDSNYLTNNAYYHGALEVAAEGAIPKVSYTITVPDIAAMPGFEDYEVETADTSFIEDIGMFGINKKTGLPNHLKVIISELNEEPDNPSKNTITVQNFTTQFEDLFQQVTASVQSLTLNENIYHRASNFTSLHYVEKDSLQGTLDTNDLILLKTDENNIQLNAEGQTGSDLNNHTSQYKLNGQGLFFSNNGGQSWNVGVGPNGINADYIKAGTLDAGKIRIADSGYIYFAWDKDGIFAYRDPTDINSSSSNLNDFSVFNKYGLSIVKDGKIRLRSGYSFTGTEGTFTTEKELGNDIGFFLYNSNGDVVLRNFTSDDSPTARLAMQGEMFVTDSSLNSSNPDVSYTFKNSIRVNTATVQRLSLAARPSSIGTIVKSTMIPYVDLNGSVYHGAYRLILISGNSYYISLSDFNNAVTTTSVGANVVLYRSKGNYNILTSDFSIISTTEYTTSSDTSVIREVYPEISQESANINSTAVYYINGTYYKFHSSSSSGLNISGIGIYLNNQTYSASVLGSITERRDKRIFSCLSNDSKGTNNILTILRNGHLFIGGQVTEGSDNDISNIADVIKIENEKIRFQADGKIYLDFNKMYNTNGNSDLVSYIKSAIGSGITDAGLMNHFHFFTGDWGSNIFGTWGTRGIGWHRDAVDKEGWYDDLLTLVADLYRGLEDKFLSTINGTNNL